MSKILEKNIFGRSKVFFDEKHLFSSDQFLFHKEICNHAINEVREFVRNYIDNRASGCACIQ